MSPRVSVLIPVYNGGKYVGAAIESVLAQTYKDYEIIVADDGSTDNSAEAASSYSSVRFYRCEHKGVSATRNFLLSKAEGELIAFIDADDLWTKDKLEKQVGYLDEHPECGIVFCRYKNFTDIPERDLTATQRKLLDTEIDHYLTGACMKRSLYDTLGFFNSNCIYGEDTDFTARLVMGKIDLSHKINSFLYLRRIHTDNLSIAHNDADNKTFYKSLAESILMKRKKERL